MHIKFVQRFSEHTITTRTLQTNAVLIHHIMREQNLISNNHT